MRMIQTSSDLKSRSSIKRLSMPMRLWRGVVTDTASWGKSHVSEQSRPVTQRMSWFINKHQEMFDLDVLTWAGHTVGLRNTVTLIRTGIKPLRREEFKKAVEWKRRKETAFLNQNSKDGNEVLKNSDALLVFWKNVHYPALHEKLCGL